MKKSLIEEPTIELLELFDDIGKEAIHEKRMVAPTNKSSYWWTRKPLIVGRTMALTSTLDSIQDVRNLLSLRKDKRAYLHIPDVDVYKKKLGRDPSEIKVLDPFAGSGNLIFPSVQLGLDCTCSDYNPLAYLIEKSMLDFPVKFREKLLKDFEKIAKQVIKITEAEVGKFFHKDHSAYIWCWCINCPHCEQRIPLINNMYIVKNNKNKIGMKIIPKNNNFSVKIIQNISEIDGKQYTQKGGKAICISCKNSINYKTITNDIAVRKDREMLIIQTRRNKDRGYIIPTAVDKMMYEDAKKQFNLQRNKFEKLDLIPYESIYYNPRNPLKNYGIMKWNEYFDDRQILVLCTFLKNIRESISLIKDKEYQKAISTYLMFMLTQRVNMAGFGVAWYSGRETPVHILTFRQPVIAFNFAESNPFLKTRGSFHYILENILAAIHFSTRLKNKSECMLKSVTDKSNTKYDLIITDPPYGDDVQYGELSEFFYVWAYRVIKNIFPELPKRVIPLEEDFCESWGRFSATRNEQKSSLIRGSQKIICFNESKTKR